MKGQEGLETLVGVAMGAQASPLGLGTHFCCLSLQDIYVLWPLGHSWDPQDSSKDILIALELPPGLKRGCLQR